VGLNFTCSQAKEIKMLSKLQYLEELRMQLGFVDTVEDYEEIIETIRELEDSLPVI
jgi:hypothetical protein